MIIKPVKIQSLTRQVAKKLDIPEERALMICEGYWKFIKASMEAIDFTVPLEQEPNRGKRTRFNVPYIGKIICKIDNGKQRKETKKDSCKEEAGT